METGYTPNKYSASLNAEEKVGLHIFKGKTR